MILRLSEMNNFQLKRVNPFLRWQIQYNEALRLKGIPAPKSMDIQAAFNKGRSPQVAARQAEVLFRVQGPS